MATINDPLQEGETRAMSRKHQIMTGGQATARHLRRYGPSRWIPFVLLAAALLVSALLELPRATQSAQAAPPGMQSAEATPPPNPTSIYFLSYCSNTYQTTAINTPFSENLAVCVGKWADVGARNNHVAGIAVTFTAIPSRAGASGIFANGTDHVTVISGSNGMATATTFSANGTPGSYVIAVTAPDSSPTSYSMTNGDSTVPAVLSIGDGSLQAAQIENQMTQVNTAFRIPLSVTVLDGQNNYMPGVTVTFTAPDTGASGTFANGTTATTAITNSTGVATSSAFTANGTDGTYFVTVSVGGLTNAFTLQNTLYNPFGVPVTISLSGGSPQTVDIETPFPSILQVVVVDGALNYVPGATVTFKAVPGLTGASGTFANGTDTTTATSGPTGLASATQLTANHAAGQFSILVTAGQASTSAVYYNLAIETTTTLTNAPTSTTYGQPVTLTATVSPVRGASVPTGFVAFKDNGTVIDECKKAPLSGNVATCQATTINAGERQITADYLGDAGLFPSTSNAVTQTVHQASTSTTLHSSLNPSNFGQSVTFTANVAVQAPGGGTPTGTITFMDGTTQLGTPVNLDKGQAALPISTLGPGDHAITAVYGGSPNYITSTSAPPLTQTVLVIPTKLVVSNYPSPTTAGVSHTVTVTAKDDAGHTATNYSGTVTLAVSDAQAVVGAAQPLTGGTGTFAITFKRAGTQTITATGPAPSGDGTLSGSQSGIVVQAAAAANVVAVSGDGQSATVGTPFTQPLVVKVTDAFGNLVPGAAVTFTGSASGASATFSPNPATTGSDGTTQTTATANTIAGGPYTASATVQGVGTPATFSLTNTAVPALVVAPDALPNGAAGQPYAKTTFTASGGSAPYHFAVTNGTLPTGLTLDAATSALGGTPTQAGSFTVTVTATDANQLTGNRQYTFTIGVPTITLTPSELPAGVQGSAYPSQTLGATGGTAPYTFAVTNGALPGGLLLDTATGILSGTPSATGTFSFTVTVTDANKFTATQQYSVTITEAETTDFTITAGNTPTTTLTLTIGQSSQLSVQKVSKNGSTQSSSGAQWTVSDPQIASVDANGKVTGLSAGTATITARLNGVTRTLTITVTGQTQPGSPASAPGGRSSGATGATGSPAPAPTRNGPASPASGSASPASGGSPAPSPVPTGR